MNVRELRGLVTLLVLALICLTALVGALVLPRGLAVFFAGWALGTAIVLALFSALFTWYFGRRHRR